VSGVGCPDATSLYPYLQVVLVDGIIETVVSDMVFLAELLAIYVPYLIFSKAGGLLAYAFYVLYDEGFLCVFPKDAVAMFVVGLLCHTKLFTERFHRIGPGVSAVQPIYRLVPTFFKLMP
jgi:hypothetical protein